MLEILRNYFNSFAYDQQLRRWAEVEWKKDADFAYYSLKSGNNPYEIRRKQNDKDYKI
jgi:hypothetical protein